MSRDLEVTLGEHRLRVNGTGMDGGWYYVTCSCGWKHDGAGQSYDEAVEYGHAHQDHEQSLKCNCLSTKLAPCPVHWEEIEQAIAAEDAAREDTLTDDDEVFSAEGQGVGALVDADTLKPCPQCDRKLCQGCVDRADFPDHNTIPEGYEIVPSEEVLKPRTKPGPSLTPAQARMANAQNAVYSDGHAQGVEDERERIVRWLRECETEAAKGGIEKRMQMSAFHNAADMIEDGSYRV